MGWQSWRKNGSGRFRARATAECWSASAARIVFVLEVAWSACASKLRGGSRRKFPTTRGAALDYLVQDFGRLFRRPSRRSPSLVTVVFLLCIPALGSIRAHQTITTNTTAT